MLEKIIKDYSEFSDSWISEIIIFSKNNETVLELIIHCANKNKNYNYEKVKISFKNGINYKIIKDFEINSFAPKDVFINKNNDIITFDFYPIDHFDYLEENPKSNFIIKCKDISYEILSDE
jgi:hypothetical protein